MAKRKTSIAVDPLPARPFELGEKEMLKVFGGCIGRHGTCAAWEEGTNGRCCSGMTCNRHNPFPGIHTWTCG